MSFISSPDNFFKKMTDLESPRKNNDCYFYYYSTCAKGENCMFRHEPSALGCETMCSFWKEGKCLNVHCNFRHMELRKNRKAIPCYWESQPGGCLKPHCPFLHQNPKPAVSSEPHEKTDSGTESADNSMTEKLSHISDKSFKGTQVDSLVVNFEEESDNESAPTNSPVKTNQRAVKVKTLEEIKLEKIQAESAAYYSYSENENILQDADNLRRRIWDRLSSKNIQRPSESMKRSLEAGISGPLAKKQKNVDLGEIKIKTLAEIRAERTKKSNQTSDICDSLVSSSTEEKEENVQKPEKKLSKIKLQRNLLYTVETKDEEMLPKEEITGNQVKTDICESSVKEADEVDNIQRTDRPDEVLLLQDDDDSNVSLKDEERLLNELDDFLQD